MEEKKRKPYTMEEKDDGLIKKGEINFYIQLKKMFFQMSSFW